MISIRTLRWISVVIPVAAAAAFEWITHSLHIESVPPWGHAVVVLAAFPIAAWGFSTFVFAVVRNLERELYERNKRLALLLAVANEASESLDTEEVASTIIETVAPTLSAKASGVALTSEVNGRLELVASSGATAGRDGGWLREQDCVCNRAIAEDTTVVLDRCRRNGACAKAFRNGAGGGTCVGVPVRCKGNSIGVLFVARPADQPFTADEIKLVAALGSQVGPVLQNAQLFSRTGAIAVLQERQRVAHEVHDTLAQTLSYLNTQTGLVECLLARDQIDDARAELGDLMRITRDAHRDLRQAIADLRTPLYPRGDLGSALRDHVVRFQRRTGILCHYEGRDDPSASLSAEAEAQLLRIVQEALTNVSKHAPGSEVSLKLDVRDGTARVIVRDDGPGFNVAAVDRNGTKFGLQTMKERAESVGGRFRIDSRPSAGTAVEVVLPLEKGRRG